MDKRCMGCMELYGKRFEVCPNCGYIEGTEAEEAIHMEPGTLLYDRYIVGKVLGFGGFGITYIGWDGKLQQKVAIKEYLPSEFSTRMPGQSSITVFNGERSEQFRDGLIKFVEEAKKLAKFQNEPGIVKVFDSITENETAYIIMELLDGETLTSRLKREKTIPEDEAVNMLTSVLNSLQVVHQEGILHRDIAPDNIFLTKAGEVKLIDFGASRYATTSHSRSLTVIIKPGYSPEEQYRSRGDQGPYTDVYAIAATLYKMITGKTPPDAMERRAKYENQKKEILIEPHKLNKDISINRENAILNAMNVRIEDRTVDVLTFMNELSANPPVKRRYGKIKKIDLYSWPLWLKILVPSFLVIFISLGVLLVTGVIDFPSLYSSEVVVPEGFVVVPDVEGLDKDEALQAILDNNLNPSPEGNITSAYIDVGKIVLQTPIGGSYLEENGVVVLTVSSGEGVVSAENGVSIVPYVVWDTQEVAIEKLKQAGLAEPIIVIQSDESVAAGQVISQSIEAGESVDEGTQITLTVSSGGSSFAMPNVVGSEGSSAESLLTAKGFIVTVEYEKNNSVAEGNVISQSISSGTLVKKGTNVTIRVSSGEPTVSVSNIIGKNRNSAVSILESQGFTVVVLENYDSNVANGNVISQSPTAGTLQIQGSTITITVSKGIQPVSNEKQLVSNEKQPISIDEQPVSSNEQPVNSNEKPASIDEQPVSSNEQQPVSNSKQSVTVSFNGNGGSVSRNSSTVYLDSTYGTLPTSTRDYYTFTGWYTAANGGSRIDTNSTVTNANSHTLYAQWAEKGWSDYIPADSLPNSITSSSHEIQYQTRYSYRDKSTTTSTESSLNGWTQDGSAASYGGWTNAGWTTAQPAASDTIQITDTRIVTDAAGYTNYNLFYYRYWNSTFNEYLYTYSPYMGGTHHSRTVNSSEVTHYGTYDGNAGYTLNDTSARNYSLEIWFVSSTTDVPDVTHTEWHYQTRTKTINYNYYAWSDWSEYSETSYSSSSTREVRTKEYCRYRQK